MQVENSNFLQNGFSRRLKAQQRVLIIKAACNTSLKVSKILSQVKFRHRVACKYPLLLISEQECGKYKKNHTEASNIKHQFI